MREEKQKEIIKESDKILMLTAFCFLFDGRNNLRFGLAILYVEKVNISREQKLIKYFKQRNSDISG